MSHQKNLKTTLDKPPQTMKNGPMTLEKAYDYLGHKNYHAVKDYFGSEAILGCRDEDGLDALYDDFVFHNDVDREETYQQHLAWRN